MYRAKVRIVFVCAVFLATSSQSMSDTEQLRIALLNKANYSSLLADLESKNYSPEERMYLRKTCSGGLAEGGALALLPIVLNEVIDFVYALGDSRLEEIINNYISQYGAVISDYFYEYDATNSKYVLNHNCIRVKRGESLDFIARIDLSETHDAVRITPLLLAVPEPSVPGDTVAVTISLGMQLVSEGSTEDLFSDVVLSREFDVVNGKVPDYWYYEENEYRTGGPWRPAPIISVDSKRLTANVNYIVEIAEVGAEPKSVKALKKFLSSNAEEIKKTLSSSILKAITKEEK